MVFAFNFFLIASLLGRKWEQTLALGRVGDAQTFRRYQPAIQLINHIFTTLHTYFQVLYLCPGCQQCHFFPTSLNFHLCSSMRAWHVQKAARLRLCSAVCPDGNMSTMPIKVKGFQHGNSGLCGHSWKTWSLQILLQSSNCEAGDSLQKVLTVSYYACIFNMHSNTCMKYS